MEYPITPTRGGKRQNAGRKPRAVPLKAVTVRLEPEVHAKLKAICKARQVSQAGWITGKVRREKLNDLAQTRRAGD